MSSKLSPPDGPLQAEPVVWRQVGRLRAAPDPGGATGEGAEQLRRQWEERLAEERAAARREGEAAGRSRAQAELDPVLGRLARTIEETAGLRARLRREAEADTVKLAMAIARRVIRRELAVDPEALHGLVLGALEKLQAREICRVRVHPSQVEAIAALLRNAAGGATIEVAPDGSRDPGAAVFETERGNLDASVETQLGEIERGLADLLGRQG